MSAGAERSLRSLGVSRETITRLTTEDLTALDAEVERFFAYGYGQASQRRFLTAPHPSLGFRSPVEALARPGGVSEVLGVVRRQLAALERGA